MEVRCYHCASVQDVGDDIFGNHEKASVTCSKCGKPFQVINPKLATFRAETTRRTVPSITSELSIDGLPLSLPEDQEVSLKVLDGKEKGTVYPVYKPRITIGRANADVIVNDLLSSRVHCSIEVCDRVIVLRDLESTNGTFVNEEPIQTAKLENGSTFRIGAHSFQVVVTPKEA